MSIPKINKFLREQTNYPNKKVVVVEMVDIVNNKYNYYESFIGKDEAELIKFIMFNLKQQLSPNEIDRLWDLIEAYGDEKFSDGYSDGDIDNEMLHADGGL